MGVWAISLLTRAVAAVVSWFDRIIQVTGTGGLIRAGFAMLFVVGVIIIPLRGAFMSAGASDFVKNRAPYLTKGGKYARSSGGRYSKGNVERHNKAK